MIVQEGAVRKSYLTNKIMKIKTLSTIRSYPYVYRSFLPHRVMTVAIKPVNKAVQSKNM